MTISFNPQIGFKSQHGNNSKLPTSVNQLQKQYGTQWQAHIQEANLSRQDMKAFQKATGERGSRHSTDPRGSKSIPVR